MIYRNFNLDNIGDFIDVSSVKTDCAMQEVDEMIDIVVKNHCICASPMPWATEYTIQKLAPLSSAVTTGVVSFPSGAENTRIKVEMAKDLTALGCRELDMVINAAALLSGQYDVVRDDVRAVVEAADGVPVKTILEVCYLSPDLIARASTLCVEAGASYIKTGTGWGPTPTTAEHVRLIRSTIGNAAKIKAAGGVRSLDILIDLFDAGCDRFGIGVRTADNIFRQVHTLQTSA